MKIEMEDFKYCLVKTGFSIGVILEINQYKKSVEQYRTNLISSGNRRLRPSVSIFNILY
jgi:hypothetical protein